jgi:putative hemolysin
MSKGRKATKKARPPETGRRSEKRLRRFEGGLATTLALGFLAVLAVGGRIQDGFQLAATTGISDLIGPGWTILPVIVVLLALNMLLTAGETAVETLRPAHIRVAKERNGKRFERLEQLLEDRTRIVAACTFAAQLMWLAMTLCTFLMAPNLLDVLRDKFGWANNHANLLLSAVILLVPVGLAHLLLGVLLPKSYASVNPISVASRLHPLIMATAFVFSVPAGFATRARAFFVTRFGAKAVDEGANLAEEEIKTIAETGHETGEIEVGERELLHSVFEFTDTVAREVMTPRVDVDAMPLRSDPTEVVKLIQESGHSRIPLYEDTDDQIVGIIHAKDLFGAMLNGKAPNLKTLMRPALFVPENKSLHELLAEMRQVRSQMAVVQDEFGGTAGIVTIEDIVEELVGDIIDEYDVEEPEIVEAAGGWLVDARTHLDDLNSATGADFQSEEFDTIGGYVFGLFGRQPKLGDQVEYDGWRFIVAESDGRRIGRLKLEQAPETAVVTGSENES